MPAVVLNGGGVVKDNFIILVGKARLGSVDRMGCPPWLTVEATLISVFTRGGSGGCWRRRHVRVVRAVCNNSFRVGGRM